jgi:hypothetical protein
MSCSSRGGISLVRTWQEGQSKPKREYKMIEVTRRTLTLRPAQSPTPSSACLRTPGNNSQKMRVPHRGASKTRNAGESCSDPRA